MQTLKNPVFYKFQLLLIFGFLLMAGEVRANHNAGGEITYQCLGNNRYQVTVRAYRDCWGDSMTKSPLRASCGSNTIIIPADSQKLVSVKDITKVPEHCQDSSKCKGGNISSGIEEYVWTMNLDLSGYQCCQWLLSWTQCCRQGIPQGTPLFNLYINATLNNCLSACNSSPKFNSQPYSILCVNQGVFLDFSATDSADGDTLSYHLVGALQNQNQTISYLGALSPIRPLTFLAFPNQSLAFPQGFHIDTLTGQVYFTPTSLYQYGPIVVEIKEWRTINGIKQVIGTTRRDMQFIVRACQNNSVPTIKSPYTYRSCAGEKICFPIETEDTTKNDTTYISLERGVIGATFTNNNGKTKYASGEICWTTDTGMINNKPYQFFVSATANTCPYPTQTTRVFEVWVGSKPEAVLKVDTLSCGRLALSRDLKAITDSITNLWQVKNELDSLVYQSNKAGDTLVLNPGKYFVKLNLSTVNCDTFYQDSVIISQPVQVNLFNDTFLCQGDSLLLTPQASHGKSNYLFDWYSIADTTTKEASGNTYLIKPSKTLEYFVEVTDALGCKAFDTVLVQYIPKLKTNLISDLFLCKNDTALVNPGQSLLQGNNSFAWSNGDNFWETKLYQAGWYRLTVTDSMGCKTMDSVLVHEITKPEVKLGNDIVLCKNDTVSINPGQTLSQGNYNFAWSNGDSLWETKIYSPGSYWVYVSDGFGCSGYDTIQVLENQLELSANKTTSSCVGDTVYATAIRGYEPYAFAWKVLGDTTGSIISASAYFIGTKDTSLQYIVSVSDSFSCTETDTISIQTKPLPLVDLGGDTLVCSNTSLLLNPGHSNMQNSYRYLWNTLDTVWQIKANNVGKYWVEVIDTTGCKSSDTISVSHHPIPPTSVSINRNGDSLIADKGFWEYSWFDANDSLLQQGTSNSFRLNKTGTYYVKSSDSANCFQVVSLKFDVITLSSQNTTNRKTVELYPNPCEAGKAFVVESESRIKAIFDSMGRRVRAEITYKSEKSEVKIDNSGVYVISMEDGNNLRVILY